jgi:hypothetical protein
MNLPTKPARKLGVALLLALSVASVSVASVSAQDDRPVDPGVRCAAKIAPGEYEFYMPGAKVTDVNGNKWVCGPDGQWFRDYSAIVRPPLIKVKVSQIQSNATLATYP